MIELVDFKPEHMVNIEKKDVDTDVLTFIGDLNSLAERYALMGPTVTLLCDGEILVVGGVVMFWKGVGEAWMMVSPLGREKSLIVFREMGKYLQDCFDKYGFHRIQTCVLTTNKQAHKSTMRLGFIPEGMMINYGPGKENYIRYVKLGEGI